MDSSGETRSEAEMRLPRSNEPKGHEQGRERRDLEALLDDQPLHPVPEEGEQGRDDDEGEQRGHVRGRDHDEREVGGQHREVAVGEVDNPHDAEEQRQPAGKERVEAAEEDPLDDCVDPVHAALPGPARPARPK